MWSSRLTSGRHRRDPQGGVTGPHSGHTSPNLRSDGPLRSNGRARRLESVVPTQTIATCLRAERDSETIGDGQRSVGVDRRAGWGCSSEPTLRLPARTPRNCWAGRGRIPTSSPTSTRATSSTSRKGRTDPRVRVARCAPMTNTHIRPSPTAPQPWPHPAPSRAAVGASAQIRWHGTHHHGGKAARRTGLATDIQSPSQRCQCGSFD